MATGYEAVTTIERNGEVITIVMRPEGYYVMNESDLLYAGLGDEIFDELTAYDTFEGASKAAGVE